MAFKILIFLVIFKLSSSMADPNVNINVNVNVGDTGDDAADIAETGDDAADMAEIVEGSVDSCFDFTTGKIVDSKCGQCQLFGDPHIFTFDDHKGQIILHYYAYQTPGIFTVIQDGLYSPSYGLNATMVKCWTTETCVSGFNYYEPGLEITIKLPEFNHTCYPGNSATTTYSPLPECKPEITASHAPFAQSGDLWELYKSGHGVVTLFKHNHQGKGWDPDKNWFSKNVLCYNIVGSYGLSMSLCMSTIGWYSNLYVWASPTLRGKLYGLCDTFTNGIRDGYEMRNGTLTTDVDLFASTWTASDIGQTLGLTNLNKCTNKGVLAKTKARCDELTEDVCKVVPKWQCEGFRVACVYDLCRVTNADHYEESFANHLHFHTHLAQ